MKQCDTVQAVQAAETPRLSSPLHLFARLYRSLDPEFSSLKSTLTSSNSGYGFLAVAAHKMTWRSAVAHSPMQCPIRYVEHDRLSCQTTSSAILRLGEGAEQLHGTAYAQDILLTGSDSILLRCETSFV